MVTRRDVLQLAAALGLGRTIVPQLTQAEAALDGEYQIPPSNFPVWDHEEDATDPANFAERGFGLLAEPDSILDDIIQNAVAKELADYYRTRALLYGAVPALRELGSGINPLSDHEETITPLYQAAFDAGLRIGAQMERLRLATITAHVQCDRCQGIGTLDKHGIVLSGGRRNEWDYHHVGGSACPDCEGRGYNANPQYGTVRHGA